MNRLNLNNDLFLGVQELGKLQSFYRDRGLMTLIKLMSVEFGVVKAVSDTGFESFEVSESTVANKVEFPQYSYAIDSLGNIISNRDLPSTIAIPTGGAWNWVKISFEESVLEEGVVSLAEDGSLSGVGTNFSKSLRGQPDFPTRIALYIKDANGNYTVKEVESEVVTVLSDTSAIIGVESFGVLSDAKFAVIGTFTPGVPIPTGSEYPFRHTGCKIELVEEVVTDTAPAKEAYEYYIARVKNDAGTLTIQDKRALNIWSICDCGDDS